jgi:histidinol phosphatase-like enzyme
MTKKNTTDCLHNKNPCSVNNKDIHMYMGIREDYKTDKYGDFKVGDSVKTNKKYDLNLGGFKEIYNPIKSAKIVEITVKRGDNRKYAVLKLDNSVMMDSGWLEKIVNSP